MVSLKNSRFFKKLSLLAALSLLGIGLLSADPLLLHEQLKREPVTDGVELIHLRRFDEHGWLNISILEIDLTATDLKIDALLGQNQITGAQPFSKTAEESGAIAGINGDFFHIGMSNAPLGVHIQNGKLLKSPPGKLELSIGFDPDLKPFIGDILFKGKISSSTGSSFKLSEWNHPGTANEGIILYNRSWGENALGRGKSKRRNMVHAIFDSDGTITRLLKGKPGPAIPENGSILLGRGRGAAWLLENAQPGEILKIEYETGPENFFAAIGGHPLLVKNDKIVAENTKDIHPRSAVGFNREKTKTWWVVVDGRHRLSRGMTFHEISKFMQSLGASEVLNLDGGGSSTLISRLPGTSEISVRNFTADGAERNIPNGLGIFPSHSSGLMKNLLIESPPPADPDLINPGERRLAPGASFQPKVFATDEKLNPVDPPAKIGWKADPPELGSFSNGTFTAKTPGTGKIIAAVQTENGSELTTSQKIRVIDNPVKLRIDPSEISGRTGETIDLKVTAIDIRGYSAPLKPDDLEWQISGNIGKIENGAYQTGGKAGSGALIVKFGNLIGAAPIAIGSKPEQIAAFRKPEDWFTATAPEQTTCDLTFIDDPALIRDEGPIAKLAYDFSATSRTRAAYIRPKGGKLDLPGRPLQLSLWAYGDGNKAWLRGQIVDATGTARAIDFAREIDWTGWKYVEAEIPEGTSYPISLHRIYVVEPRTDTLYKGEIYLDTLDSIYAPDIDPALLPEIPAVQHPANRAVDFETTDNENFQFIVFGDSKVDPSGPDSAGVTVFNGLIDRINRHDVEFIIYTGDLIENDTTENFEFGKSFLEKLRAPYHMVIANHEIAGTDSFDNYRKFFGDTYYSFKHGNSEFITLNASRPGGLRESEPEQWPWLLERLGKSDAKNIFISAHIPVIDPMPGGQTGWLDKAEVAIFQDLLTKQAEKGQNIYFFNGHVHGFDRRPNDGVEYITTAGGGSPLYMQPDQGGFFHYVIFTVQQEKITYQVIPLLEKIELPETIQLSAGKKTRVKATGIAPDDLVRFPLEYPAATEWEIADETIARFDSKTNELHGLKPGETTLTIRSDLTSATTKVIID